LFLVLAGPAIPADWDGTRPGPRVSLSEDGPPYDFPQNKELERFFAAKAHVFRREWRKAVKGLEKYLKDYPKGRMCDEALYWLALSLNRMSREQQDVDKAIRLKEEAVEKTEALIGRFADSLWLDDARTLRVEIAGELVMVGKGEYQRYVDDAVATQNKTATDLKLAAIGSLIRMEPETAVPTLKRILKTDEDPVVRRRCALLLGRNYGREAEGALRDASNNDPDRAVRDEARYWIERIRIRNIPVELSYYAFAAWFEDPVEFDRVPENKLNRYSLDPGRPGAARAQASISDFFRDNVERFGSTGSHRGVANMYTMMPSGGVATRISHKINDFQVQVVGESIEKSEDRIKGEVRFWDLESGDAYTESFEVNRDQDVLFATRRGEQLAVMLLQFEENWPQDESSGVELEDWAGSRAKPFQILSKIFGVKDKPVYYSEYSNWMGCKVETTLQTMDFSSLKGDKYDFSLSKATIPGPGGKWELTGYLIGRKDRRQFLGRMATLVDPEGKVVAVTDEITVPINDPSDFEVRGSRLDSDEVQSVLKQDTEGVTQVEGQYAVQGCLIFSRRSLDDLEADVIDFGTARAEIPVGGRIWILMGHLTLKQNERYFVALDARLIGPDGQTAAQESLMAVPIDSPSKFRLLK
jgi:hypothetical protein